jgi:hypothetical protein
MPSNMEPNTEPSMEPDTEPNMDLERDRSGPRLSAAGANAGASLDAGASAPAVPGYETRDANTSGVLLFIALLATTVVLVLLLAWGLFRHYSVSINNSPPDSPFTGVREVPSPPRLQVTPREDLQRILADQQSKLETYGWEDRQAGTVRIPIERAMDLLVQKGLPVATPGSSGQSRDNSAGNPGSPNASRDATDSIDAGDQERVPGNASAPAGPKGN